MRKRLLLIAAVLISASLPAAPPARVIDCNKAQPKIAVKSSVDNKVYGIDVCSVADSAEGEDFRVQIP